MFFTTLFFLQISGYVIRYNASEGEERELKLTHTREKHVVEDLQPLTTYAFQSVLPILEEHMWGPVIKCVHLHIFSLKEKLPFFTRRESFQYQKYFII